MNNESHNKKFSRRMYPSEYSDRFMNLNNKEEKILRNKIKQLDKEETYSLRKINREIRRLSYEKEEKEAKLKAERKNLKINSEIYSLDIKSENSLIRVKDNRVFQTNVEKGNIKKCSTDIALVSHAFEPIEISRSKSTGDFHQDMEYRTIFSPISLGKIKPELELRPYSSKLEKKSLKIFEVNDKSVVILPKKPIAISENLFLERTTFHIHKESNEIKTNNLS